MQVVWLLWCSYLPKYSTFAQIDILFSYLPRRSGRLIYRDLHRLTIRIKPSYRIAVHVPTWYDNLCSPNLIILWMCRFHILELKEFSDISSKDDNFLSWNFLEILGYHMNDLPDILFYFLWYLKEGPSFVINGNNMDFRDFVSFNISLINTDATIKAVEDKYKIPSLGRSKYRKMSLEFIEDTV